MFILSSYRVLVNTVRRLLMPVGGYNRALSYQQQFVHAALHAHWLTQIKSLTGLLDVRMILIYIT